MNTFGRENFSLEDTKKINTGYYRHRLSLGLEDAEAMRLILQVKMTNSIRNAKTTPNAKGTYIEEIQTAVDAFEQTKNKMYFHSGFITMYNTIADSVSKLVDKLVKDPNVKNIIFTGHSLGAVLAKLSFMSSFLHYTNIINKFYCYAIWLSSFRKYSS